MCRMARSHHQFNHHNSSHMKMQEKIGGLSVTRQFQLHDRETVCKLFLNICRQYDLGNMTEGEFVQKCMTLNDDAENLGIIDDPLTAWES